MTVAKAWRLSPDEWYKKPRWARAAMVAQHDVEVSITWWDVEDKRKD